MINKDTTIYEAMQQNPNAAKVFEEFGMHCLHCPVSRGESIEQAAMSHGINLEELLAALSKA